MVRIATGPAGSFGAQFATALVHLVNLDHPHVRVQAIAMASDAEALQAVASGTVDLAVARSDANAPIGQSIVVLRHDAGLFVIPHGLSASGIADLKGVKIGVVGSSPHDMALLGTVLQAYGLPAKPEPIVLGMDAIAKALHAKSVQALFVVGATGGTTIAQAISAVRKATRADPKLLTVDEVGAIVKHNHLLESVDLPKGSLQGQPPLPDDDDSTLGVSTRLFASASMGNNVAAELTRMLLADKPRVASLMPKSALVEPPETDKINASLPVHPGAAAYLSGNQPTLSDQAQNALYWFGILMSLFVSCATAIVALVHRFMPARPEATLRMLDLWVAAREADTIALDAVERDVDALVQDTVRKQVAGKGDELNAAFPLLVEQVRRAIERRRNQLAAGPVPVATPEISGRTPIGPGRTLT
ncbi:MAG: TAXI family TRAP transporter solute-binding subunit [Alsobacter sp.]